MIIVTCAIIEHNGKVLAVQRGPEEKMPGKWEFAGGKLEPDESLETCVRREILEELNLVVEVLEQLSPAPISNWGKLVPFRCRIIGGTLTLHEHQDHRWLPPRKLLSLDFTAADIPVVEEYLERYLN